MVEFTPYASVRGMHRGGEIGKIFSLGEAHLGAKLT